MKNRITHFGKIVISLSAIMLFTQQLFSQLPSPWQNMDIGKVVTAGSATWNADTFTVKGSGLDIGGSADAFHFVYRVFAGNGELVARVMTIENTHNGAKCGVMIRESLAAGSKHALSEITRASGVYSQTRTNDGGSTVNKQVTAKVVPMWLKVTRLSNSFKQYYSANGTTWTEIPASAATIVMKDSLYYGLVVTSRDTTKVCAAQVTNITYTSYSKIPPTGLVSSNVLPYSFDISWSAQNGAVNYIVLKDGVPIDTTAALTAFVKGGIKANTTYNMTVKAIDAFGNVSDASVALPVLTGAPDLTPPPAPTGLAAWDSSNISFRLKWNPVVDNISMAGYIIYKNGDSIGFTPDTFFKVTGLVLNTVYTMTVKALDDGGNKSVASAPLSVKTVVADITPPSIPSNIKVTNKTTHSFSLSWTSTDNVALKDFEVIKNGVSLGKTTTPSFTVNGLAASTTYSITIKATDMVGNTSATNPIAISTLALDVTPPSKPTGLEIYDIFETSFSFTWDTCKDNVGVTGYIVYIDGVVYDTLPKQKDINFTGLKPGTYYDINVIAMDAAENLSLPSKITGKTLGTPIQITEGSDLQVTVFPNPASEFINLSFQNAATDNMILKLVDIQGKIILSQNKILNAGQSNLQIDVNGLKGSYILKLIIGKQEITRKITIE